MTIKESKNTGVKVYVAVSGGVDSSVALALLQGEGYSVTGVYFKTYKPDGNREYCRQQGMDAQAVCKHLGVPFRVFDLEEEYEQKVFDYMIAGYRVGQTPNPDIMCNKEIKFGVFAQRAFADGADYIATGHYARVQLGNKIGDNPVLATSALLRSGGLSSDLGNSTEQAQDVSSKPKSCGWPLQDVSDLVPLLMTAVDNDKDQTYFLSQVSQEVLAKTLFPIGEYEKSKVRELAEQYGLHTASKKDSQGICFIGQEMDVKDFLKKYIPEEAGDVLSVSGEVIGTHTGAKFITLGERHGFTIKPEHKTPDMPRMFVIQRDITANTITVGTLAELEQEQRGPTSLLLADTHWINEVPEVGKEYMCRIRHRGVLYKCTINCDTQARLGCKVEFIDMPYAPAPGQFLALYDGDRCLGGGVMV